MAINDNLNGLKEPVKRNKVLLGELTLGKAGDVVDISRPRRLVHNLLKSLEKTFGEKISSHIEPKLVGDVLIMPGFAFVASNIKDGGVGGHYAGTWKNDHAREQR